VNVELYNRQSARHSEISYVNLVNRHSARHSTCYNYQSILKVNI
jgi:hypothetical protein